MFFAKSGTSVPDKGKKKTVPVLIITAAVVAICAAAVFLLVTEKRKAELESDLIGTWYAAGDSITKVLEIQDGEIEYRAETEFDWLNTTIGVYEWKAISGNKIKIKHDNDVSVIYTVKFTDGKTIMTITPAVTSANPSEIWFLHQ